MAVVPRWAGCSIWTNGSSQNPSGDRPLPSFAPSVDSASPRPCRILIVEDNKADVYLIREAIQHAQLEASVHVVPDGDKAIGFFETAQADITAPCPDLVILDLNLPKVNGEEVLKHLRSQVRCSDARVVIVTSSDSPRDREKLHRLGADAYFRKPSDYTEFLKLGQIIKQLLS
jgi:CheY-like chemotaxis protein